MDKEMMTELLARMWKSIANRRVKMLLNSIDTKVSNNLYPSEIMDALRKAEEEAGFAEEAAKESASQAERAHDFAEGISQLLAMARAFGKCPNSSYAALEAIQFASVALLEADILASLAATHIRYGILEIKDSIVTQANAETEDGE